MGQHQSDIEVIEADYQATKKAIDEQEALEKALAKKEAELEDDEPEEEDDEEPDESEEEEKPQTTSTPIEVRPAEAKSPEMDLW